MPAKLVKKDGALEVSLAGISGSGFNDALTRIKSIPGRRFDFDRKVWKLPAEGAIAERVIQMLKPECSDELREWVREERQREQIELTTPLPDDADLLIPWANERADWQPSEIMVAGEPLPFNGLLQHQRPAVDLMAREKRVILADDMGLGKTGTSISAVEEWRMRNQPDGMLPSGPRLVIAPNSVKGSWARELRLWLGQDVPHQVIDASSKKARENQITRALADDPDMWIVLNYEMIRVKKEVIKRTTRIGTVRREVVWVPAMPVLMETEWLAIIADEIHRVKNHKAQATKGIWRLQAPVMFGLSGTPVMNRPDELWSPLAWLFPDDYHERGANHKPGARAFWAFALEYTEYEETFGRKEVVGVKNPDGLRFELGDRLVRRTQGQVLDLPGKVRIPVPVTLNKAQAKLYDEAEKAMWLEVAQVIEHAAEERQAYEETVERCGEDSDEARDALNDWRKAHAEARKAARFIHAADAGEFGAALYKLPNGAARTVRLRQIIETPFNLGGEDDSAVLDACVDRIMDSQPSQWAVFCEFKPTTECLKRRLEAKGLTAEVYHGDVSPDKRTQLEDAYQRGEIDVLVGTTEAMYQGITLTAGYQQFWCSRPWNPKKAHQGEDRQNRIGQRNRVMVYIAEPEGTVATSKVRPKTKIKEGIIRAIIAEDAVEEVTENVDA